MILSWKFFASNLQIKTWLTSYLKENISQLLIFLYNGRQIEVWCSLHPVLELYITSMNLRKNIALVWFCARDKMWLHYGFFLIRIFLHFLKNIIIANNNFYSHRISQYLRIWFSNSKSKINWVIKNHKIYVRLALLAWGSKLLTHRS